MGKKVVLNGSEKSDTVEIKKALWGRFEHGWGTRDHAGMARTISFRLGKGLATFNSAYTTPPVMIVGPQNENWRAQHILWQMRRFYKSSMKDRNRKVAKELKDLEFSGIWAPEEYYDGKTKEKFSGRLTVFGPVENSLKRVPKIVKPPHLRPPPMDLKRILRNITR